MSQRRDFYDVLGVSREAGEDDIRRAYKKAAVKYHPDRNQGDAEAEAKFKEATEAYAVLSDDEKRGIYDQYGHAGLEGRGGFDFNSAGIGDIFSQFQDVFSDFFGGFGGFGGQGGARRRGPQRGRDIRVEEVISLAEAVVGCKKEVTIRGAAPCESCDGSGAAKGSSPETCVACRGSGQVTTQRGFIMFSTPCGDCGGSGEFIGTPCDDCAGRGAVEKTRSVLVTFPAGIDAGQRMRVPAQGMPGPNGAPPGDLYVDVEIAPDERFERRELDLITRHKIAFAEAALGTDIEVEMPDETVAEVKVSPGTQPGSVITLQGKGIPSLDRRGRGALHVLIDVHVPKKLSKRAKKLLRELEEELGDEGSRAKAG